MTAHSYIRTRRGQPPGFDYHLPSGPTAVPEPGSLALFATGLAGLAFMGWRRRKVPEHPAEGADNAIRRYRTEGNVDKARKMLAENREKLSRYNRLNRLAQKLNQLDKRIIRVREHKTYSGAVKRE